ncbi:PREDICTED: protein cereblon-like [Papilio polytes]|uniref:protein cereblon-like n=1 Tax=Papilio polytes TaxID=76194 RepID=UPI0006763019|nr:PREDICTED: protein cereblon-like [Papilio polytes]
MDEYLSDSEGDRESEEELSEVEQANAIVVETVSDSSSEEDEGSQVMVRRQPTVVEKHFDKSLAATHSYMGRELIPLSGHAPLEAGWRGRLPVAAHTGAVFPGETVPMLLPDPDDATILSTTIQNDKLFGLLCPDATGALVSGYGNYILGSTDLNAIRKSVKYANILAAEVQADGALRRQREPLVPHLAAAFYHHHAR